MPYAYLVAALIGVVAMGAAGYQGYRLGGDSVRAEYAKRDIAAANEAATLTKATQEKYRAKEQASADALAAVSTDYQKKLTDAQAKTAIALNAIRSGSVRLRDPGSPPGGSCPAETAASTAGRDGSESGRLSGAASEFLLSEAARADAVVLQLTACQGVVAADRR